MSWRIEQADALTLMRELPDRWAQTCVTSPLLGSARLRSAARDVGWYPRLPARVG